jgi:hypothetical protein
MNKKDGRRLDMGASSLEFSEASPDPSPGAVIAVAALKSGLERAGEAVERQRSGVLQVRAATARKEELRRTVERTLLPHVARVAQRASREIPELAQRFVFNPGTRTYLAFRTAARGMAAEAETHKELLVKYGLAETVFENLLQALDQFDAAVESGKQGRQMHVGARAEISAVADEVVEIVRVLDGLNRYRFRNDPKLLAAWDSASNVLATPKNGASKPGTEDAPPTGGEVRPAA